MNFKVMSDGACDLTNEILKEHNIDTVPFYISIDGFNYKKEGVELDVQEFYQHMVDNPTVFPKTSMPTTVDFVDAFTPYAQKGIPLIFVTITEKFSGSYNNACLAKQDVLEEYPDAKIEIINSMTDTCIQGLFVLEIARMQEDGLSFEEAIEKANRIRSTSRIFFTINGLDYLHHGGRIGKLTSIIGNTLKLKPLIVLKEGEIFPKGVALTRKLSIVKVCDFTKKYLESIGADYHDYRFVIGYGYDKEEGEHLLEKLKVMFPETDIILQHIGATIGVHTGPYPIGIGFVRKYDSKEL